MEILIRAKKEVMSVGELPITVVDRINGEHKLGANGTLMYLKGLLQLFFDPRFIGLVGQPTKSQQQQRLFFSG